MNLQTRGREGDPKQQKNWRAYLMDGILHEHINRESIFGKIHFQIQNNKQPKIRDINDQTLQTTILEQTYVEDAIVPEQVAQEIIFNGRNITRISAGPYSGYLQVPL